MLVIQLIQFYSFFFFSWIKHISLSNFVYYAVHSKFSNKWSLITDFKDRQDQDIFYFKWGCEYEHEDQSCY